MEFLSDGSLRKRKRKWQHVRHCILPQKSDWLIHNISIIITGHKEEIQGTAGDDLLDASSGKGKNKLKGGSGDDTLLGRKLDILIGGSGDDLLDISNGKGRNKLKGGGGNDELFGYKRDLLVGGAGDDLLDTSNGKGRNKLKGGNGDDILIAGHNDILAGGTGDDLIWAKSIANTLSGGEGEDDFWLSLDAKATITDFEAGVDLIHVVDPEGIAQFSTLELIQDGNDTVIAFRDQTISTLSGVSVDDLNEADFSFLQTEAKNLDSMINETLHVETLSPASEQLKGVIPGPFVSLSVTPSSVKEDGNQVLKYTFSRIASFDRSLTVDFDVSGSAILGQDYTQDGATRFNASSGSITLAPYEFSKTIEIDPIADNLAEENKTVELTLNGRNSRTPKIGNIIDDDNPIINISVSPSYVLENDERNKLVYTFTRSGPINQSLRVRFDVDGTANSGQDYTLYGARHIGGKQYDITFASRQSTETVTVEPKRDLIDEEDETVELEIKDGDSYDLGAAAKASGIIVDNNKPTVKISPVNPSEVTEDGNTDLAYTFTRTGPANDYLTVDFVIGGTADLGKDYNISGTASTNGSRGSLTFEPSQHSKTIIVDPIADTDFEEDETVTFALERRDHYHRIAGRRTGTILNDDPSTSIPDNFKAAQYLASHPDLINAFGNGKHRYEDSLELATQHYLAFGHKEPRSLDSFNEAQYLASHPDLIDVFDNQQHSYEQSLDLATQHYIEFGYQENRALDNFDEAGYLATHADLRDAFGDGGETSLALATKHYIEFGHKEGRILKTPAFLLHTGTPLHEVGNNFDFISGDYNRDGIQDLYVIGRSHTGTNSPEVHVLNGANNFQSFLLHTGTALQEADASFDFMLGDYNQDGIQDLYAIKRFNTGTKSTEVHVLNGANNFQSFLLHTGTALQEADASFDFMVGDYNRDGIQDLYAVKRFDTGTQSTEVHVLNGANNFQSFLLHTGTDLHEVGDNFDFMLGDFNRDGVQDLYAIKRSDTGTQSTEVHVLNGANNYQPYLWNTGTILHEVGPEFDFVLGDYDRNGTQDLYAIKRLGTGTNSTEVHVLNI